MNLESFTKTPHFRKQNNYQRFIFYMCILDSANEGLTYSDLKERLKGYMRQRDIVDALESGCENCEIWDIWTKKRNNRRPVYKLEEGVRMAVEDRLYSISKHYQKIRQNNLF